MKYSAKIPALLRALMSGAWIFWTIRSRDGSRQDREVGNCGHCDYQPQVLHLIHDHGRKQECSTSKTNGKSLALLAVI